MHPMPEIAQRDNTRFRIFISIIDLVMRALKVEMLDLRERQVSLFGVPRVFFVIEGYPKTVYCTNNLCSL